MPTPDTPAPEISEGVYWIPEELRDAYHLSLGRFIDAFGSAEATLAAALHQFLTYRLGRGDEQAWNLSRAILGSKRTAEMKETITRLLRLTETDESAQKAAANALNQLSEIQHVRDRIAHNGAGMEFYQGAWMIGSSNHNQVRERRQIEQIRLTIEDMDNMTEDLWAIMGLARIILLPFLHPLEESWEQDVLPPWRYKPSALKRHRHNTQPKRK